MADERVTEDQRRVNSILRDKLRKWRKEYGEVSVILADLKGQRASLGGCSTAIDIQIEAMRYYAAHLMSYRSVLKQGLRRTAYRFV